MDDQSFSYKDGTSTSAMNKKQGACITLMSEVLYYLIGSCLTGCYAYDLYVEKPCSKIRDLSNCVEVNDSRCSRNGIYTHDINFHG